MNSLLHAAEVTASGLLVLAAILLGLTGLVLCLAIAAELWGATDPAPSQPIVRYDPVVPPAPAHARHRVIVGRHQVGGR